jgi:multiple sugar transport system ATP-binding protein
MTMATRVGVLENGQLVQTGTPRDIYEKPVNLYVAGRLGQPRINVLPADLFPGAPVGARTMALRPEHIRAGHGKTATVARIEHLGDQTRLHLTLDGHQVVTLAEPDHELEPGDALPIEPLNALYFDASGARIA